MSISTPKKRESIRTFVQLGILATALLAICILLGISMLISSYLTGQAGMIFLLIISFAIVLLVVGSLVIMYLFQKKVDTVFLDVAEYYRAYSDGNYTVRAPIYGSDAFAILITTINGLLERQKRRIEEISVQQLEINTEHKAQGRLRAIETLQGANNGQTDNKIQQNAQKVSRALRTIVDRTVFQEQASRAQTIQIFQTTEKVENIALSLQQLARNMQGSTSLAQAGLARLRRSDEVLSQAIDEMSGLQKGTQRAAQQVYGLGEQTQAVRSLVSTIEAVATHITLLSEHMLLLDSPDDEANVDADNREKDLQRTMLTREILSLAMQAVEAATQVATLTSTIEVESHKAVAALQTSNQEVEQKARQVKESGAMLQDLYQNMEFQASMLQDMAQVASEQKQVIDEASTSMSQIAKMAYQNSKETQQNVQGLKKISSFAEQIALPSPTPEGEQSDEPRSIFSAKQQRNA